MPTSSRTVRLLEWGAVDLDPRKRAWLEKAIERVPDGLDVQISRAIDEESRAIAREHKLDLGKALNEYKSWKKNKTADHLLSRALRYAAHYHASTGVRILEDAFHKRALGMALGSVAAGVVGAMTFEAAKVGIKKLRKESEEREAETRRMLQNNRLMDDPTLPFIR